VAEQLAAAVEYLDATTRVAPELIDIDTVLRLTSTVEDATQLVRPDDSLIVDCQHLSAAASIALLMGQPALGEADPQSREVLALEARRLLGELEEHSSSGATMTTEDIWNLRVVGDALDLAEEPDGRQWMRLADVCRPGLGWPTELQKRLSVASVRANGDRVPNLTDQSGRLRQVAHTWNNVNALPEVAALQSRRYRHGRGLIGEHNRVRSLLNWRALPLAAVFGGSVLLALVIALGRQIRRGEPVKESTFTIDLAANEALAMSTALLAVAGAVAVALAVLVRPESTLPIRYEAARRWWTVGTVVILVCGGISVFVGVLELASRGQDLWWASGLTLVVGTLHFLLAFGISQWQDEPRLLAWTERHDLDSLQSRLHTERQRLSRRSGGRDSFWPHALAFAAVIAGLMSALVVINAGAVGEVTSATAVAALITGVATLAGGMAVVRIAVEWRRLRLIDPGGRAAQISLATASFTFALFLAIVSAGALLINPGGVSRMAAVLWLVALLGFLLIVFRSGWSARWPTTFIRRRALQIAERTPDERKQFARRTREG
jgi:hypothetical protein